jgi:hypothetical protein
VDRVTVAPTRSAVVVYIPEAEPVVGHLRAVLDRAAQWGVGAHVTVTFPFVPPPAIDAGVVRRLARAVAGVAAFDVRFEQTAWFGQEAVFLAPEPAGPFRDLTLAVLSEFPEHPPYEGEFPEIIPHLTVGHLGPPDRLGAAEREARLGLPFTAGVQCVHLIAGAPQADSWHTLAELRLGSSA